MKQEDKELLIKEVYANQPYGVIVFYQNAFYNILGINCGRVNLVEPCMSRSAGTPLIEEVKLVLRPLSTITEKEEDELQSIVNNMDELMNWLEMMLTILDWYRKKHFDCNGMIEKDLAVDITKLDFNPYTNKPNEFGKI